MSDLIIRDIFHSIDEDIGQVKKLLKSLDITLDPFVSKTVAMYDDDRLVATGSIAGNTIRSIGVDSAYQGQAIMNKLITYLIDYLYRMGKDHIFIYTKPANKVYFEAFGFFTLVETEDVLLLDSKKNGLQQFIENCKVDTKGKVIGSIVMNGNPFTLGHKYLVETALKSCDELYLFLVWEQESLFPNDVRLRLIQEGLNEYSQVHICKGEDYIISSATFPTYFLQENADLSKIHASLDLKLFRDFIAPELNISKRYVGQEKICKTTNAYNKMMKSMMKESKIEVIEMPRKEVNGRLISASYVREYIRDNNWEKVKNLVPVTTYDYLISDEAKKVIKKVQLSDTRH